MRINAPNECLPPKARLAVVVHSDQRGFGEIYVCVNRDTVELTVNIIFYFETVFIFISGVLILFSHSNLLFRYGKTCLLAGYGTIEQAEAPTSHWGCWLIRSEGGGGA